MKRHPNYVDYFFYIWALLLIVALLFTKSSVTEDKCRYYDEKIAASRLAKTAMEEIKAYKEECNIPLATEDTYQSGMIGDRYTVITTTLGNLQSKKTSVNPNFAAVIIDMFKEAEIKPGDEVAMIFSSSFPALNLCVMAAAEVFNLKTCVMISLGASSYGANDPDFTYLEMAEHLKQEGYFTKNIDYVSLGGESDLGTEFPEDIRNQLLQRIEESSAELIYIEDYVTNIDNRLEKITKKLPNVRALINVGGNLVSMGKDEESFSEKNGLIFPTYIKSRLNRDFTKIGLIDRFLDRKIPIMQMLNIKGLALEYGLPYNPPVIPEVGDGDVYYEAQYGLTVPFIALGISVILPGLYYGYRKKYLIL